jgi:lipopolysaccharide transport system permease protein
MTPMAVAPKPRLVIEPGGIPLRQYGRDLLDHRDLVPALAVREIKLRYRQTALGVLWIVVQPLLGAGILAFVFGRVAGLPTDGVPFFVFTYAGLLAWTVFSACVSRTAMSLVANARLVSKTFFPRLILPLSVTAAALVDFAVCFGVMIVLLFGSGLPPDGRLLLLPVWVTLLLMLAQGLGSVLAAVGVWFRDVVHVTPFLLMLGLYASPVAYSAAAVPDRYLDVYNLNPLVALLGAFRWSLFGTPLPTVGQLVYAGAVSVVAWVAGAFVLKRLEPRFADVI